MTPHRAARSPRSERTLRHLLTLAPVLAAVGVAALALDALDAVQVARARVLGSSQQIEGADRLLMDLQDAETGQRGYLLTGDRAYLAPYRAGAAATPRTAAALRAAASGEPAQLARLDEIDRLAGRKLAELAATIRQHDALGPAAALATVRTNRGKATMDSVRLRLAGFRGAERARMRRRVDDLGARTRLLAILILAGGVVTAAVAFLTSRAFARHAAEQARMSADLAAQNERLNEQAVELEAQNQHMQEQAVEMEAQAEELTASSALLEETNSRLEEEVGERLEAERALRVANDRLAGQVTELAALAGGLEAFSYSVSHDLRAPLGAINGLARILEEDHAGVLGPEGRSHLARIAANAAQMGQLIDGLLEMSRVSHGELSLSEVDLSALAAETVDQLRRGAPERLVEVRVEPGLRARGDRRLLLALAQNLLSNAWKFTREATPARIEVGRLGAGQAAPCGVPAADGFDVFYVRDNGAGFDDELAGRLFAPFQRLHGAKAYEGTGIGLATVERIVQRHGGAVCGSGAVGRGATLYFSLPAV